MILIGSDTNQIIERHKFCAPDCTLHNHFIKQLRNYETTSSMEQSKHKVENSKLKIQRSLSKVLKSANQLVLLHQMNVCKKQASRTKMIMVKQSRSPATPSFQKAKKTISCAVKNDRKQREQLNNTKRPKAIQKLKKIVCTKSKEFKEFQKEKSQENQESSIRLFSPEKIERQTMLIQDYSESDLALSTTLQIQFNQSSPVLSFQSSQMSFFKEEEVFVEKISSKGKMNMAACEQNPENLVQFVGNIYKKDCSHKKNELLSQGSTDMWHVNQTDNLGKEIIKINNFDFCSKLRDRETKRELNYKRLRKQTKREGTAKCQKSKLSYGASKEMKKGQKCKCHGELNIQFY